MFDGHVDRKHSKTALGLEEGGALYRYEQGGTRARRQHLLHPSLSGSWRFPRKVLFDEFRGHPRSYLSEWRSDCKYVNVVIFMVGLRVSDGCLICVDVVEGVMMNTECCIRHAVSQGVPIVVAFTKMDRFITDLKLPPQDAYFKIFAMLEEVGLLGFSFIYSFFIFSFI